MTKAETTLAALAAAMQLLANTGVMTILAYPGHKGGELETELVHNFCQELHNKQAAKLELVYSEHPTSKAPLLLVLNK
jgi:hypothetical protein